MSFSGYNNCRYIQFGLVTNCGLTIFFTGALNNKVLETNACQVQLHYVTRNAFACAYMRKRQKNSEFIFFSVCCSNTTRNHMNGSVFNVELYARGIQNLFFFCIYL